MSRIAIDTSRSPVLRSELLELFLLNRSVLDADAYRRLLEIEQKWISPIADRSEREAPGMAGYDDLMRHLTAKLEYEEANPSDSDSFIANTATRDQFAVIVEQFAIDGLTEAQSFLPIVQRLPDRSRMAVLRVIIDEFGCGNIDQSHSRIYHDLMIELGLSTDISEYFDTVTSELLEFVNLFYWLAARASLPDYFLGALAYLEASILYGFRCFASACERLDIDNSLYYTEHLHIDNFHMREMQVAIRELDADRSIDCAKVWAGIELASTTMARAVDSAVAAARGRSGNE